MFYLIVISNIFQIFFSFILLDQISLKKRTNLIVSVFILFLVSSVHLNLRLASLDELVLSALLLTISFMNHQRQAVGVTLFHLSFAFIVQNLAVFLLSPSSILFYIATQASEFVIFLYFLFTLFMVVLASLAIRRFVFTRLPQKWQQYSGPILFMLFFTNKVYALYQYLLASPAETQFDTLIKMFVITLVFVVTLGGISIYIFSNNQKSDPEYLLCHELVYRVQLNNRNIHLRFLHHISVLVLHFLYLSKNQLRFYFLHLPF